MLVVGSTVLCIATFLWIVVVFSVEMIVFKFENMESFLVEQMGFRLLEVLLSGLILYFLRNSSTQHQEQSTEKKSLIRS